MKLLRSGIKSEENEFIIDLTFEVEEYEKILKKKEGKDMIERCDTKCRICAKTAYNYMIALGFKYDTRKKSYYTDTHEKQENIRYRIGYCKRYIEEYEPYTLRWFLVPLLNLHEIFKDVKVLRPKKGIKCIDDLLQRGKYFEDTKGVKYIEFHIDAIMDLPCMSEFMEPKNEDELFGHQSVFREDKEHAQIIIIVQDEAIFKQYLVNGSCWYGAKGEFKMVPKDEGMGFMVSVLCSREFGLGGPQWTQDLQDKVNAKRKGESYYDTEAAKFPMTHN